MFVKIAEKDDIAPGGMRGFDVKGKEITVCNDGGRYYALARRCGHMNAPLDRGTLVGYVITCPMHCAQFDATTGRALARPVPHDPTGGEKTSERLSTFFGRIAELMSHIKTCDIKTFKIKVEDKNILVDI